jgi:hypothetical protein
MNKTVLACFTVVLIVAACSTQSTNISDFAEITAQVDEHSSQISKKQNEIRDILAAYNQTVSKDSRFSLSFESGSQLSEREYNRLAERIEREDDPSCKSILAQVSDLNDEIRILGVQIAELYAQLPPPYKVQGGEDHYALCSRFLQTEHKLPRVVSDSLLARTHLMNCLVDGFDVWCLYDDGRFATHVAQGSACISPSCLEEQLEEIPSGDRIVQRHDSTENAILQNTTLIGSATTQVSLK